MSGYNIAMAFVVVMLVADAALTVIAAIVLRLANKAKKGGDAQRTDM